VRSEAPWKENSFRKRLFEARSEALPVKSGATNEIGGPRGTGRLVGKTRSEDTKAESGVFSQIGGAFQKVEN
jgi:hypothetical protein